MSRQELMEEMEEIQLRWYNTFKGTNEADLMIREEIADLLLPLIASKEEEIKEFRELLNQVLIDQSSHLHYRPTPMTIKKINEALTK